MVIPSWLRVVTTGVGVVLGDGVELGKVLCVAVLVGSNFEAGMLVSVGLGVAVDALTNSDGTSVVARAASTTWVGAGSGVAAGGLLQATNIRASRIRVALRVIFASSPSITAKQTVKPFACEDNLFSLVVAQKSSAPSGIFFIFIVTLIPYIGNFHVGSLKSAMCPNCERDLGMELLNRQYCVLREGRCRGSR
jgi:hypothetical protein